MHAATYERLFAAIMNCEEIKDAALIAAVARLRVI
jgi:hypothetical protein